MLQQSNVREQLLYVGYVEEQLRKDIDTCEFLPFQFDEMTDMLDVVQLCVFIRIGFRHERQGRATRHFGIKRTHQICDWGYFWCFSVGIC